MKRLVLIPMLLGVVSNCVVAQADSSAQIDGMEQDSVARVILAEELATFVPSYYANLIVEINDKIVPQFQVANRVISDPEIYRLQKDYDELSRLTDYVISRNNILENIESLERRWQNNLKQIKDYTEDLKLLTNDLVSMKRVLATDRNTWLARRAALAFGHPLPQIHLYVESSVDTIDHFLILGASTLDTVTFTYTHLTELQLKTQQYADEIRAIKHARLSSMIQDRGDYIWRIGVNSYTDAIKNQVDYLRTIGVADTRYYFKEHKGDLATTFLLFVFITFVFYRTRHRSLRMDDTEEPEIVRNPHILTRPLTMSVLLTIIGTTFILPNNPPLLSYLIDVIVLYCVLAILVNMVPKRERWTAYVLAGLYVLLLFSTFIRGDNQLTRWLTLATSIVLTYLLYWVRSNKSYSDDNVQPKKWQKLYIGLCTPLLVLSLVAIVSNIIGYGLIAELINKAVVFALITGLLLVATYESMTSILFHLLDTSLAKRSIIIREDNRLLFNRSISILGYIIIILFGYYCLNYLLLWEFVYNIFVTIWDFGYTFGSVSLTIGGLISLFLTVLFFWILASAVQILIRREIFPRIDLPRGVGNAVASITHYSLIVIGIFLALATAGFELRHLGILAGALGIGIGFGLQNIVNNFLSGLILIFERPITVDDVVEVDGLLGVVTSIGIRASRIRQYNGDEMIVPNADLISKKVTNRTLSDTRRRYTMNFETSRGVDPERVIAIISEAAQGVEGILPDPPAKGYFKGMGEQSIKFYVNYWGAGNFLDLMSEVEQAVYAALEKEGIKMPVPVQIEIQKKKLE